MRLLASNCACLCADLTAAWPLSSSDNMSPSKRRLRAECLPRAAISATQKATASGLRLWLRWVAAHRGCG